MSLRRLGSSRATAGVAAKIADVGSPHLASVIVTNLNNLTTSVTAYVAPDGSTDIDDFIYVLYNFPVEPGNSLESHRFAMNAGDEVWVESNIDNVSFLCEGIPQTGVNLLYSSGITADFPLSPLIGDLFFDTTVQKLYVHTSTGWKALTYEV